MKRFRDASVPAGEREWLSDSDFELAMDDVREKVGDGVFVPGMGIDVDLVLMRNYKLSPDFVELPPGVLGRTTFHPDGALHVEVCRHLANEAENSVVSRRRLRSTLAHECGHIVFHRHHFVIDRRQQSLFVLQEEAKPQMLCRGETIDDRVRKRDGREYQANRGMASLLLPAGLVKTHVAALLSARGYESLKDAVAGDAGKGVFRDLCDTFDVSLQMAVYRVQDLKLLPKLSTQEELGL